jgi:hypothetical protein
MDWGRVLQPGKIEEKARSNGKKRLMSSQRMPSSYSVTRLEYA